MQSIINAITMIRGTLAVTKEVADSVSHMAQIRVRQELGEKLFDIIHSKPED